MLTPVEVMPSFIMLDQFAHPCLCRAVTCRIYNTSSPGSSLSRCPLLRNVVVLLPDAEALALLQLEQYGDTQVCMRRNVGTNQVLPDYCNYSTLHDVATYLNNVRWWC
jgi:hypothetical protein